ncbi:MULTISPECIES: polysialyltransferase family glycosyltransferase [unclassified Isoptericola]|uniref:polysialyltransferase family glycosyltransferase n=1 Tax=unclassified Isoptericola TaxID=2623355 RepID=UPI003657C872
MTTLHLVTGLYSAVNSFASRYVGPEDDHHVVVLFSDPADEPVLAERIRRLRGVRSVALLPEPAEYLEILADPERMTALCGGRTPGQLRMFLSHSHWLLDALAGAFPDAGVSLFEEGMAGLYPDNLRALTFLDRVVRVEYHHYLGAFAPLSALDRPELFEEIDATAFTGALERACGRHDAGLTPDTVVLVEQYFDRKGDAVSTDELVDVYRDAVEALLAKGYRVAYKPHPRHASAVHDRIAAALPADAAAGLSLMSGRDLPLEVLIATSRPAAVVAVSSTLLLTAPHLLGVPSFRVDVDFGLRMSASLGAERTGQLATYLALRDRVPALDRLPAADVGVDPWTVLERQFDAVPPTTQDPLLAAVRGVGGAVTSALPAAFRTVLATPARHVSFDVFDTLVTRPAGRAADLVSVLDRELAPDLPPMARYSNARNAAVSTLRAADRASGTERDEYPIEAVADQTARLLGGVPDGKTLLAAEVALEERHLAPRALGAALMLFAHRLGKRVGLVSDTFYSAAELLELVGPHLPVEPRFVVASADADATKASGALFDVVLRELGTDAGDLLHVGDNRVSDVERAAERGIETLHVPAAADAARRTHALGGLWRGCREEKGLSLVKGVVAQRFFDNPFVAFPKGAVTLGTPYALGYAVAGPALLGWTLWVARQARDLGYDDVSFLARDGYVPHRVYERLRATDPDLPPGRYLLASRRAAFQVFSGDPAHVAATQFVHGLNPANTPRTLLTTRFGAGVVGLLEPALARAGIAELDAPLGRDRAAALTAVLVEHAEQVAAACAGRSAAARRHYAERLGTAERPVVVDLGYSGSSQRAIMTSLGRRVDGLYFTGMEHALEYAVITGARFEPWSQDRTFFRYGTVLEYLLTPVGLPECHGFGPDGRPVLAPTVAVDRRNAEIQRGVADFVDDVFARFGERVPLLAMRPDSATWALSRLLEAPTAADARMLAGALQDDATGSGTTGLMDAWQPGRDALAAA